MPHAAGWRSLFIMKKDTLITVLILVGLIAGVILGQILHMGLAEGASINSIWKSSIQGERPMPKIKRSFEKT